MGKINRGAVLPARWADALVNDNIWAMSPQDIEDFQAFLEDCPEFCSPVSTSGGVEFFYERHDAIDYTEACLCHVYLYQMEDSSDD